MRDQVMEHMYRSARTALFLVAIVAASGCSAAAPLGLTNNAFESQRARWLAAGIRDYTFEYSQQCECLPDTVRPAMVEVRGGVVTDVVFRDDGEAAAVNTRRQFPTIAELFDRIDHAIQNEAATMVVSYDSELGYPTRIEIDYNLRVADDEIVIHAAALARL